MPDKPTFAQYKNQNKTEQPAPLGFIEDELGAIYVYLSASIRQTID